MTVVIGLLIALYLLCFGIGLTELSFLFSSGGIYTFGVFCGLASFIVFISILIYLVIKSLKRNY